MKKTSENTHQESGSNCREDGVDVEMNGRDSYQKSLTKSLEKHFANKQEIPLLHHQWKTTHTSRRHLLTPSRRSRVPFLCFSLSSTPA